MFGERIKGLRSEAGLSQSQLCKELNLKQTRLSSYETGQNMPSVEILESLADYFGVTVDYLLGRSPEPHGIIIEGGDLPQALIDANVDMVGVLESQVINGKMSDGAIARVLEIMSKHLKNK